MFTKIVSISSLVSRATAIACEAPTDHCWNGKLPSVGKDCKFICPTKPHFDTNFGGSNVFNTATTYCNHNTNFSFSPASYGYGNLPFGCVPAHWTENLAGSGYETYTADGTVIKVAYSEVGMEVTVTSGSDKTVTTVFENEEGELVDALDDTTSDDLDDTTSDSSSKDICVFIIGMVTIYATQQL